MTPKKYAEWTQHHAELFGLRDQSDARLFTRWAPRLMQFEFEELRDASLTVAEDPSDRRAFRENHLAMLRQAILAKRAEASARERDHQDRLYNRAECDDCFGVGLIRVPHPGWISDGELERSVFMVVACLCPAGIAKFNAVMGRLGETEVQHKIIDLDDYEAMHPDWRTVLSEHQKALVSEFDVAELARKIDNASPIDPADIRTIISGRKP